MKLRNKNEIKASLISESLCLASVIYGMFTISEGFRTLTKFTTLSNVGIGVAMLLFILADIKEYRTGKDYKSENLYIFKLTMTLAIAITFLIFLAVLAPTSEKGFIGAYLNNHCGSMAHHLLAPVFALIDFFFFDGCYKPKFRHAVYGVLTPLAYALGIFLMALCGFRWDYGMSAPYNFINFGAPTGWFGFDLSQMSNTTLGIGVFYIIIALMVVFYLLGVLFIGIKKIIGKKYS